MSRRVIPGLEAPDATLEADIRARLDRVEDALKKAVGADSELLATTAKYLLTAGGKRFRPMLVLLSGYFGDPTDPRLIPGSVAIELVHQATLYHDDVIDEADERHGVPAANARWDNTVAILTGDYLFARASELSADLGPEVCRLLAQTIAVLCDGQIREVGFLGQGRAGPGQLPGHHPAQDRGVDRHLLPPGRHALGRHRRAHRGARRVRRVPGHGLPALRRHHGFHRQPARTGQGTRPGHEGGRLHPARPPCPPRRSPPRRVGEPAEARRARRGTARPSPGDRADRAVRSSTRGRPRPTKWLGRWGWRAGSPTAMPRAR